MVRCRGRRVLCGICRGQNLDEEEDILLDREKGNVVKNSPEYDRSARVNGKQEVRLYDYEIALNLR